jgi:hypothetical protein
VAVLLTYAVFLFAIWSPSPLPGQVVRELFWLGVITPLWIQTAEAGTGIRWTFRLVIVGMIALFLFDFMHDWHSTHLKYVTDADPLAFSVLAINSVLAWGRLVDTGSVRVWRAKAIRSGKVPPPWRQRLLARDGFAIGCDGFARYEYGKRFAQLTQTEREEIEKMVAENPRGRWVREPMRAFLFDDERLEMEELRIRGRVQQVLAWGLGILALVAWIGFERGERVSTNLVVAGLWTMAGFAVTLRQALPLWTEADPRHEGGELSVVGGVAESA